VEEYLQEIQDTYPYREGANRPNKNKGPQSPNDNTNDGGAGQNSPFDKITNLRNYIDRAQSGIAEGKFEDALHEVQSFYKVVLGGEAPLQDDTDSDSNLEDVFIEMMESTELKLKTSVKQKMETALQKTILAEIERFCALYKNVGLKDEAWNIYTTIFIPKTIQAEIEEITKLLAVFTTKRKTPQQPIDNTTKPESDSFNLTNAKVVEYHSDEESEKQVEEQEETELDYVGAIRRLFEFIAWIIQSKQQYIEDVFGKEDYFILVIKSVLSLCDTMAKTVLESFIADYNIQEIVVKVNTFRMQQQLMDSEPQSEETPQLPVEPREVSEILEQMAFISQCNNLLDKFLTKKIGTGNEGVLPEQFQELYHRQRFVKEIMLYYNIIEEYFIMQAAKKAIELDKVVVDDTRHISNFVDSTFFILKQCAHRALSTCSANSASSILHMISNILNIEYAKVIEQMMAEGQSRKQDASSPLVVLNNIDISIEYTTKLKTELEGMASKLFGDNPKDLEKVQSCVADLNSTAQTFKTQFQIKYLEKAADRLTSQLQITLPTVTYDLDELKFQENEINDPFVEKFVAMLSDLFDPYKKVLTENNYATLVSVCLDDITQQLEHALMAKKFTSLGAIQLEKELNVLMEFLAQDTKRSQRNKFARLTQISAVLNLEKISDILDLYGEKSAIKWRLSTPEIKQILLRRIDFSADEIKKLNLAPQPSVL